MLRGDIRDQQLLREALDAPEVAVVHLASVVSGVAEGPETRVPWLGEHTDAVLAEALALTAAELVQLRDDGAIG